MTDKKQPLQETTRVVIAVLDPVAWDQNNHVWVDITAQLANTGLTSVQAQPLIEAYMLHRAAR